MKPADSNATQLKMYVTYFTFQVNLEVCIAIIAGEEGSIVTNEIPLRPACTLVLKGTKCVVTT